MRNLLILAVVLLHAAAARAECAWNRYLGVPDGTPLPAAGTLYYEDAFGTDAPPPLHVDGTGAVTPTRETDRVWRIDYHAEVGSQIVFDRDAYDGPQHFPVVAKIDHATPRILMYWHFDLSWTCSSADALMVQVDQPFAAVRAAWTRAGVTDSHVVVPRTDEHGKIVIELGKHNCGGADIDPDELRLGGHLDLVGIRADGSEVAITGLPATIVTDDLPSDNSGLGYAMTVTKVDPPDEPPPPVHHAKKPDPGSTTGAIVLAIVAVTMLLGWRYGARLATGTRAA